MAFNGSLLSMCQPSTVGTNNEVYDNFSLNYIFRESYKVTPNRRQDLDSGRNTDGVMQRNVLPHYVSTISFNVKSLYNNQLAELMSAIRSHYTIEKEKKIRLKYYCPDTDSYKIGDFYVPDIEYTMAMVDIDNHSIRYEQFSLEFIEY